MGSADTLKSMPDESKLPWQFLSLDGSDHMETPIELTVTGAVPTWLSGSLYRNGSGVFKMGQDSWRHLFDGFAVLHRWSVSEGKVTFLLSVLDSEHYKKCCNHNRLIGMGFGSNFPDPCKTLFQRVMSYFLPSRPGRSDNTGVNVVGMGDRLFAMTENTIINEINPESMGVKAQIDITKTIAVHIGTAHPLKAIDGSGTYYYGTNMNHKQAYNFIRIPDPKENEDPFAGAEVLATIPSRWKMNISYTHAFGVTENYFVHLEQPMTFNLPNLMTLSMRKISIAECIKCHPNEQISLIVVNKKTGERVPVKYMAPHGFVFHFVNCYEENDHVVVDVCLYESGDVVRMAFIEEILKAMEDTTTSNLPCASYARFVLPLSLEGAEPDKNLVTLPGSTATAVLREGTTDTLDVTQDTPYDESSSFELPRINDDYTGLKHRYTYGSTAISITKVRKLMKFDSLDHHVTSWECEPTHVPGEPVFVPRPGASKEDDGVVLCTILSETTKHSSYLIVLDAASFKEVARATCPTDVKMNLTFHGFFSQQTS